MKFCDRKICRRPAAEASALPEWKKKKKKKRKKKRKENKEKEEKTRRLGLVLFLWGPCFLIFGWLRGLFF